jgi:hypothetical protein
MHVPSAPSSLTVPAQASASRAGSSIVRCGRCGETQRVDLAASVLAQVRPFVQAHLVCGSDTVTVPHPGRY